MALTQEALFQSDARPSGRSYRGELWLVHDDEWTLVFLTPRQYSTVEDARDAAAAYITEFQRTGVRRPFLKPQFRAKR